MTAITTSTASSSLRSTSPSLGELATIALARTQTAGEFPPPSAFIEAVWLDVQAEIDAVRFDPSESPGN